MKLSDVYETPTIGAGTRLYNRHGKEFIIARVSVGNVCLISLGDGNRMRDPYGVKNSDNISGDEMDYIIGATTSLSDWTLKT